MDQIIESTIIYFDWLSIYEWLSFDVLIFILNGSVSPLSFKAEFGSALKESSSILYFSEKNKLYLTIVNVT